MNDILDRYTDESLARRAEETTMPGPKREREILMRVPLEARPACAQEARYCQNCIGGRYSDNLADAVRYFNQGRSFASPLAQTLDPRQEA